MQSQSICLYKTSLYRNYSSILTLPPHCAISHQQVFCLCLLDLSTAFDTVDHSIRFHNLSSWYGITNTAITWFNNLLIISHFLCPCPLLNIIRYPFSCDVPQGSLLCPILSTCTKHHSALLSQLGL